MRIFLLENEAKEFSIHKSDEAKELVAFAKDNCSKFIKEFIRKRVYVYRGIDGGDMHTAYVSNTKDSRKPRGHSLRGKLFHDFNELLNKEGHVDRYRNVAFTKTTIPHGDDFDFMIADDWYYFIPIGDYHYTYNKNLGSSDFNISDIGNILNRITEISNSISIFIEVFDDVIKNLNSVDKKLKDYIPESDVKSIKKVLLYYNKIFNSGNFFADQQQKVFKDFIEDLNHGLFNALVMARDNIDSAMENDIPRGIRHTLNSLFIDLRELLHEFHFFKVEKVAERLHESIDKIFDGYITDELTKHITNSEVVFRCKSYLLIPFTTQGDEIMEAIRAN